MVLWVFFILLGFSGFSQENKVSFKFVNQELSSVFKELEKADVYKFMFNYDDVKGKKVSLDVKDKKVLEILDIVLKDMPFTYRVDGIMVVIRPKQADSTVKKYVLKGVVVDVKGEPMIGVTVRLDSTSIGTATAVDGAFTLVVDKPKGNLVFSFIGFKAKKVAITPDKDMIVKLEEEVSDLDQVTVIAYGSRKKRELITSVSSIKADDIKEIPAASLETLLQGRMAGVGVNVQSGSPGGGGTNVAVRGYNSLWLDEAGGGDGSPLYVIDGVPVHSFTSPVTGTNTIAEIDPSTIESVEVLKDAASAAIYGSRAANGVIVIESKVPKEGRLWVTYGGNLRVEIPDLSDYNLMNAEEKLRAEVLAGMYKGNGSIEVLQNYQDKLREVKRGVDTYWLDKPLRTSVQQRHTVTLEGGDRALRYRLYVGYNHTPGVMKGSKRDVMTGSLDLQYRFNKVLLKNSITIDNTVGDESPWGSFSEYTKLNPYLRPYGENGEILKRLDNFVIFANAGGRTTDYANPMYNATLNTKNRTTSFSVRNLFSVEYNPNSDLRLIGSFSLSKGNGKTDVFRPAQHTAFEGIADPTKRGDFRRTQQENFQYSLDLTASYNKLLGEVHYVTANARMSVQESKDESYGAHVTGFPNENMDEILFGKEYDEKMTGSENTSRLIGWAGSFGYSYAYKYSADFSIRLDGSSQFGKDNRFAPFWAAGVRWDVKKENFMSRVDFISEFVLRASYGVTGTQGFAPYQSRELYSYGALLHPYLASDGTGVELVAMPNEKLKWQQTDTWNIGLELGLLNGRITARAEYFQKLTKNSLTQITLAPSLGFNSYPENMGTLENKGVELNFAFIPYQNTAKSAYWTISLNGSHNTDKLKKISEALRHMNEENYNKQEDSPLPHYEEGESINRIWAVRSLGIDPMTGEEILLKRNGKMTGEYDVVDLVPCGTTEPKWQGNINSSFAYKGFGVDVSMAYKFGGQVYNQTLVDKVENADLMRNADKRVLDLRWMKVGDTAKFKGMNTTPTPPWSTAPSPPMYGMCM